MNLNNPMICQRSASEGSERARGGKGTVKAKSGRSFSKNSVQGRAIRAARGR